MVPWALLSANQVQTLKAGQTLGSAMLASPRTTGTTLDVPAVLW